MRLLLIEDDEKLGNLLEYRLKKEGYIVDIVTDGKDGLRWAAEDVYDVIILDRMLPALDGLTVLNKLRSRGVLTPVLMLTALSALEEKVEGFEAGADDYLAKPFEMPELLARISALARRPRTWENKQIKKFGDLCFDHLKKMIRCGEKTSTLSGKEAELFSYFIQNEGQTLPRPLLLSRIWGPDAQVEEGSLDTYIYFLRNRLKSVHSKVSIQVVRGIGYRIEKGEH